MAAETLYRWSGWALIIGGVLGALGSVLEVLLYHGHGHTAMDVSSGGWPWVLGLIYGGLVLITMGFPGLYLRQAARAGRLGFAGGVVLMVGLLGAVSIVSIDTFILPLLAQWAPSSVISAPPPGAVLLVLVVIPLLCQAVGGGLLGAASVRAGVFPRRAGLLLLAQGPLLLVAVPVPPSALGTIAQVVQSVVFFLAFAAFGSALVMPWAGPATVPAPAVLAAHVG